MTNGALRGHAFGRIAMLASAVASAVLSAALVGCNPTPDISLLKVTYDPWEVLDPGTPMSVAKDRPLVSQMLRQGQGPAVALGDLVEIHLVTRLRPVDGGGRRDDGSWWVWIGFYKKNSTEFPAHRNVIGAGLMDLRQGSLVTFLASTYSPATSGTVEFLPFGDLPRYQMNKSRVPLGDKDALVWADRGEASQVTEVEITHVCRGKAEQRLVTLFDDSPITVAQDLGRSYETKEPRWRYLREARWEGTCNDGKHASFQYGPIRIPTPPPGKETGIDVSILWGPWLRQAWKQVPVGVVLR